MITNEIFGWFWIGLGVVSGVGLGLGFAHESWLGGYSSWTRRLIRLGHVSFFGLGILNVLFALSAARIALPAPWPLAASVAMIAGAVLMALCCGVAAWRPRAVRLFAAPVVCVGFGVTVTWVGLLVGALRAGGW